jgi:putative peptidoglycan lipid II flippase
MIGLGAGSLTGFLRHAAIAHQMGAGREADVFLVANSVPELIVTTLVIVLPPAFIPLFTDCRLRAGENGAWRFGLRVAGALIATLLPITALVGLAAPLYLGWLAPGFDSQQRDVAVRALRVMLPAIILMGLTTLAGAALQVYRRFARPALTNAVFNIAFVITLFAAPLAWTVGRAAWGVTLGATAALLLQLPLLWRYRPPFSHTIWRGDSRSDEAALQASVRQLALLAVPFAAGYAVHHVILLVDRAMATTLGVGDAAVLNYAYRLALVIGQLSGLAVSTAMFPRLAEQIISSDMAGARSSLAGALRFVWMVGFPATCGLILLREPLVRVLFERGAFDAAATAAVSAPLVWYGLAVLSDALCQPLWRVVFARRSAWTVLSVNGLQTGIRLACNLAFLPLLGYTGLALSAAVGLSVQAWLLGRLARGWLGPYLSRDWWHGAARVVLATAVALLAAGLLVSQLSKSPMVTVLAAGFLGGLVYLGMLKLLDAFRLSAGQTG